MNGKEQFKTVKNDLIDEIVTVHDIDKDTAYKALAEVLSDNSVWTMVSTKLADKFKKSPLEIMIDDFFKFRKEV